MNRHGGAVDGWKNVFSHRYSQGYFHRIYPRVSEYDYVPYVLVSDGFSLFRSDIREGNISPVYLLVVSHNGLLLVVLMDSR